MANSHRLPSLDGLRALAIAAVILSHIAIFLGQDQKGLLARIIFVFVLGHLGVLVFFTISGFLITGLLLKDPGLPRFYFRRTLRIFIPFYAYLLITTVWRPNEVSWPNLVSAVSYTSNYCFGCTSLAWNLRHTWSLSIEEQFYLVWPVTLLLLGRRKGMMAALAVLVIAPILRVFWVWGDPSALVEFQRSELVADSMAVGCVLALTRDWLHNQTWYLRLISSRLLFASLSTLTVLITVVGHHKVLYRSPIVYVGLLITLRNFFIAYSIDWCLTNYRSRAAAFLNARPLVFIGLMSYSIYLWQEPFFRPGEGLPLIFRLGLIAIASLTSYFLMERPAFLIRNKLEPLLFDKPKAVQRLDQSVAEFSVPHN